MKEVVKSILEWSALILAIVNGFFLLRLYLRDKPRLLVERVEPEEFAWFFQLPDGEDSGKVTTQYGYLVYIYVINQGLRDVTLKHWYLKVKPVNGKQCELKPFSIPEPQVEFVDNNIKTFPVLGLKGLYCEGETMIKSGDMINGFAYYVLSSCGGNQFGPLVKNGMTKGELVVRSAYGNKASAEIKFKKTPIDEVKKLIPDIDRIHLLEYKGI